MKNIRKDEMVSFGHLIKQIVSLHSSNQRREARGIVLALRGLHSRGLFSEAAIFRACEKLKA